MTVLTVRGVAPELKQRLRVRAARNGRSMEAELRRILEEVLGTGGEERELDLAESIRRIIEPLGGVELDIPPREPIGPPVEFDE